ncbi:MAG: phosphoglucosamine mutase [Gammaproteobacteria bacterium]|nr:MAG: phosphoglucosamine mutase [Gammaproteobacteria bacterium]TND04780.1 MAG: phosphoglucosamine mutase [Gammaproteobacteria bacterium]
MTRKHFGTDGIRGRVGQEPITAEFVLKLGWAAGKVLAPQGGGKVLIGKDTRISGYMFESALQAGLSAAGVNIRLLGPMPTPAIAYLTRTLRAQAGIVISASHNPYYDNGLKFFSGQGTKLPDDVERQIEEMLDQPMRTVDSSVLGKVERVVDAAGRYIEFCKSTVPNGTNFRGMTIVVDCAHGATYHVAPNVFKELGANVIEIGVEPDGLNINSECGSTHPQALQAAVLEHGADLGVALDGDGDRVLMVDHKGELVDGDELMFIIVMARLNDGCLGGGVVGTIMTNLGLEHALMEKNIRFERAPVGDRYVMERLLKEGWLIGGETSGHVMCLDRTTTGDGIIAALQVLAAVQKSGCSVHELKAGMTKFPQYMVNVTIREPVNVDGSPELTSAVRDAEKDLGHDGRVLLRASGTEPVFRVMVEGSDAALVKKLANNLAHIVKKMQGAPAIPDRAVTVMDPSRITAR